MRSHVLTLQMWHWLELDAVHELTLWNRMSPLLLDPLYLWSRISSWLPVLGKEMRPYRLWHILPLDGLAFSSYDIRYVMGLYGEKKRPRTLRMTILILPHSDPDADPDVTLRKWGLLNPPPA